MKKKYFIAILILAGLSLWICVDVKADRIVLKDGAVEESSRVWESERYVHFILEGTEEVEIRFAKEIVERIEYEKKVSVDDKEEIEAPESRIDVKVSSQTTSETIPNKAIPSKSESRPRPTPVLIDRQIIKTNSGINLYDPRRKKRYWTDRKTRYSTLDDALEDLAARYQRPVSWVEEHMGEENDLGKIHASLIRQIDSEMAGGDTKPDVGAPDENLLVNSEIQISEQSKEKIGRPGESSKIQEIENRAESFRQVTLRGPDRGINSNLPPSLDELDDLLFYDPRRAEKYWVSPSEKYDTMNAALKALAVQYDTTIEWVETHMGETNVLSQIHQNLRNNPVK